jgi:hypothetical protein
MCDATETSREHAPPLCFFPEVNESGREYRKNLITVPSCDVHNSKKSKDDEYFRAVVVMMAAQHSAVGQSVFFGKVLRGVKRAPDVYRSFLTDRGKVGETNQRVVQIDRPRFDRCLDHLAKALFFDAFGLTWPLPITFASPNLYSAIGNTGPVLPPLTERAVAITRRLLGVEDIRGANPDVFKYRLQYDEDDHAFAFAAIFYDCFEVFSFSSKQMVDKAV